MTDQDLWASVLFLVGLAGMASILFALLLRIARDVRQIRNAAALWVDLTYAEADVKVEKWRAAQNAELDRHDER